MKLAGIQKLTLLDFPSLVACIIFTKGCNFRCPFCHNASLVCGESDFLSEEDALEFLLRRKGILEGVVVTGGEPLLHSDIPDFLKRIKELEYKIKLDTNGTNPEMLQRLIEDHLVDYVAMDIKNSPGEYASATGNVPLDMDAIERSKELLLSGVVNYEFRTTVVKGIHTEKSMKELFEWIRGAEKYFLQQYKITDDIIAPSGLSEFSPEEMSEFLDTAALYVKHAEIRGI